MDHASHDGGCYSVVLCYYMVVGIWVVWSTGFVNDVVQHEIAYVPEFMSK